MMNFRSKRVSQSSSQVVLREVAIMAMVGGKVCAFSLLLLLVCIIILQGFLRTAGREYSLAIT